MDQRDVESRINAAEAIRFLGNDDPVVDRFWEGYARGVRRLYDHMQAGTNEGPEAPARDADLDELMARAFSYGYQAGVSGHDVEAARTVLERITNK
jgi:hypothetical protein